MVSATQEYDILIIGAGMSGIYSLYKMRSLGFSVRIIESAPEVGGTWFWNRYPGARFDSESYTYGFTFSKELLEEWDWSEHFAAQPETERYVNYVCDKFDLKKDIIFSTSVKKAKYDSETRLWEIISERDQVFRARFLITCIGVLSNPTLPNIEGIDSFEGMSMHTSRWPKEPLSFSGKRVGIIGVGATGIQTIQEVAKAAKSLVVFQRTPNWTIPSGNAEISKDEMQEIRRDLPRYLELCHDNPNSFIHAPNSKLTTDFSAEECEKLWESLYRRRGVALWLSNYSDIFTNSAANAKISDFMAKKVRERVKNPEIAEKLIPKNHGFGTRRVPLEAGYYEIYDQDNVELVDLHEMPIERVTTTGIKTSQASYDLDMIIYATGFDAITGAFDKVDFEGLDGLKLRERWRDGPRTFLGMFVQGFPNMFMIMGPHQAFGNIPRSIEYAVGWVADVLTYCSRHNVTWVEATAEGVERWTKHVHEAGKGLLMNDVDSWMTGVNTNLPHKQKRQVTRYSAGAPTFRNECNKVAADNYQELKMF